MKFSTKSATDLAIANAIRNNTLNLRPFATRFNTLAYAIEDEGAIIEVHNDSLSAFDRIDAAKAYLKKVGK